MYDVPFFKTEPVGIYGHCYVSLLLQIIVLTWVNLMVNLILVT
jgi:hypothetical protein